jgi:hypothetical protein
VEHPLHLSDHTHAGTEAGYPFSRLID